MSRPTLDDLRKFISQLTQEQCALLVAEDALAILERLPDAELDRFGVLHGRVLEYVKADISPLVHNAAKRWCDRYSPLELDRDKEIYDYRAAGHSTRETVEHFDLAAGSAIDKRAENLVDQAVSRHRKRHPELPPPARKKKKRT